MVCRVPSPTKSKPIVAALLAAVSMLVLLPASVAAETPSEVVAAAEANDGVYLGRPSDDIDQVRMAAVVAEAQRQGLRLLIVAPRTAEPSDEAFALRVRQAADVEAVVLYDDEGYAWASVAADYQDGFVRALDAARAAPAAEDGAEEFLQQLLNEPERPLPEIISNVIRWTVYLLVMLGLVSLAEFFWRRWRRGRRAPAAQERLTEST